MKLMISRSVAVLLLSTIPFEFNSTPGDSAETNIQLFGGLGQYALIHRGCEGQVLSKDAVPFQELNAAIEHKFAAPVKLGVRSSYVFDKEKIGSTYFDQLTGRQFFAHFVSKENLVLNPFVNLEWKPVGIGVGYFWARHAPTGSDSFDDVELPVSAYLRFGNRRAGYFSMSLLHHIPLYTGGHFQLGFGSGKSPNFDWWLGWGFVGPYDQPDIALFKTNIRLQRHFSLNALGRVGFTEGISESAIGVGLSYH